MQPCPVCQSYDHVRLFPEFEGTCITSDMKVLEATKIQNVLCKGCGLIFNTHGTREIAAEFYKNSYSLMTESKKAAISNFSGGASISQAELTFNILAENVELQKSGRLLEAGAGKGDFLMHFTREFRSWDITAFESSESFEFLRERLPSIHAIDCQFEDFTGESEPFDVVVALGVLEHVTNPLKMLQWASKHLTQGGIFYLRVPNFCNNPNDLFCVDHLSKLTPATVECLATATGFEVVEIIERGVPVFIILRKTEQIGRLGSSYKGNEVIAQRNADMAKASMTSVVEAQRIAEKRDEGFAIFGLGPVGLFAPFYGGFSPMKIVAYIDENESVWGRKIHGRDVGGLDLIDKLEIKHVALSISPVYFDAVKGKLQNYGVSVYCGDKPT